MGKIIKVVAIAVAVVGVAVLTAGTGIPVIGALGGAALSGAIAIGATTALAAFAGATAIIAGGLLALGALSKMMTPKIPPAQLSRLNASLEPSALRKFVFGQTALAADIRYQEPSGSDQEYMDYIIHLASHRVESINELWIEDRQAWTLLGGVTGYFTGYLWVTPYLEGGPASYAAVNGGTYWGASQRLTGCAYIHIRVKRTGNGKKAESPFPSGLPSRITTRGQASRVYDPRFDSTVPGGSGSQRANDESTWRFTPATGIVSGNNTALQVLTFLLGWRITNPANGTKKLSVGKGIPANRLNLESFITAANMCDELILKSNGSFQKRYESAGMFTEGDQPTEVLNILLAHMNATLLDVRGKIEIVVAHNDLAIKPKSAFFNDGDVLAGAFNWNPTPSLENTYNVVRGRYTDPSDNSLYQLVDYPEVKLPSVDDIERVFPLDLACIQDAARAQRIAKQVLQRMQYQGLFSAIFGARAWKCKVGDVVFLTFAPLGFVNKAFRVVEQTLQMDGTVPMTLREENAVIYSWDTEDKAGVVPAGALKYDWHNAPYLLGIAQAGTTAEWPLVLDPDGTKPEDNATAGADWAAGPGNPHYITNVPIPLTDGRINVALDENGFVRNGRVLAESIADFVLDYTKFAPGYEPIMKVDALPSVTGYEGPSVVLFNGELWSFKNGDWAEAAPSAEGGTIGGFNLLRNSTFDRGGEGWNTYANDGLGGAQILSGGRRGGNYFYVGWTTHNGGGSATRGLYAAAPNVNMFERYKWYVISGYSHGDAGAVGRKIALNWNVFPNDVVEIVNPVFETGKPWQRWAFKVRWTSQAPDSTFYATMSDWTTAAGAGGIYFDDMQVEEGEQLTAWSPALLPGEITSAFLADNAVVAGKVAALAIGTDQLQANSIVASKIAAGEINAGHIAANTITGDKIQGNTITGSLIAGQTIVGFNIAGATITADKMQVSQLSALTATIGLLRTQTSGNRIELADNDLRGYYSNNNPAFRLWA